MSSTVDKTTDEILSALHDVMCKEMEYLKVHDLSGWKKCFQPEPKPVEKPAKRIKMSPNTVFTTPLDRCMECNSSQVLEDIPHGQIVCLQCGLIQSRVVSMAAHAHCSYEALTNRSRVYIHRYSRISYFWTVIRLVQGETSPVITDDTLCLLQAGIDGIPTPEKVNKRLRELKLSKQYIRHRWSLTRTLGGPATYKWDSDVVMAMLKKFRRIEYYWKYCKKAICPSGKSFFSYPGLIYRFTTELGLEPDETLLLKSHLLRKRQSDMYSGLQQFIVRSTINMNKK